MKPVKTKPMLSWILWHPLKFAVLSLVLMTIAGMVSFWIPVSEQTIPTLSSILLVFAFFVALGIMFWRMPRENIDRRSFVAVTNAQILVASVLFFVSILLIQKYEDWLVLKMMWLNIHSNALFTSVMALVGLFFLYICGIFFANLYAKYRRCRAMGVPAWKIICSMPMGFALLWTPGYLLPDNHNPDYVIPIRAKWYTRFTNWIIQNPITTVLSFIIMTVFSESFFGYKATILTLILATVFMIWFRIVGDKSFRRGFSTKYATTAVIVNIILLVALAIYWHMHSAMLMSNGMMI